jgi:hypothetical protein
MKLTAKAIKKIGENRTAAMIALALDLSEDWIKRLAKKNKENGDLTKAKALQVIREETGLTDSEILEEEPVTVQR